MVCYSNKILVYSKVTDEWQNNILAYLLILCMLTEQFNVKSKDRVMSVDTILGALCICRINSETCSWDQVDVNVYA